MSEVKFYKVLRDGNPIMVTEVLDGDKKLTNKQYDKHRDNFFKASERRQAFISKLKEFGFNSVEEAVIHLLEENK